VSGPAGETAVTFRNGAPFRYGFSIRNGGGLTVRVVGLPLEDTTPFAARLFMTGPLERARNISGPTVPFRPFDLGPGEQRMLILRGSYANCRRYAPGSAEEFTDLPVRFEFLWRTQAVSVPLLHPLVIRVPPGRRCQA
jgi:hypothetical protein